MDALTSHCSVRFLAESSSRSLFSSSKALSSPWIRFFQSPKNKIGSDLAICRSIRSVPQPSSSSLPTAPEEAGEDIVESRIKTPYHQSNTVHVRFVLNKSCLFGQQFLLVGDDPMFGLWDPSNAIPLEWSDGDVWITELDLPVGKSIQFKFILRDFIGEINWQPGPDRILQIWETTKTIVVTEDWENAENQKTAEQEPLSSAIPTEGMMIPTENMIDGTQQDLTNERLPQSTIDEKQQRRSYEEEEEVVLVPGLLSRASKEVANKGGMADASDEAQCLAP